MSSSPSMAGLVIDPSVTASATRTGSQETTSHRPFYPAKPVAHDPGHCSKCFDGLIVRNQADKIAQLSQALEIRQGTAKIEFERLFLAKNHLEMRLHETQVSAPMPPTADAAPGPQGRPLLQLFWDLGQGHNEKDSMVIPVRPGSATTYDLLLPLHAEKNALRLDVGDMPGLYTITELSIRDSSKQLWHVLGAQLGELCTLGGTAERVLRDDGLFIWTAGIDPQVYFTLPASLVGDKLVMSLTLAYQMHAPLRILGAARAEPATMTLEKKLERRLKAWVKRGLNASR